MQEQVKKNRQMLKGMVVSTKMDKTCVIRVERTLKHTLYHKNLRLRKKVFVHDETNRSKVGDTVVAVSCRPLSKHKFFRLHSIVGEGK